MRKGQALLAALETSKTLIPLLPREMGGSHGAVRLALVASTPQEAGERLSSALKRIGKTPDSAFMSNNGTSYTPKAAEHLRVGFLFPGQGAQYAGMLADLIAAFPRLRQALAHLDAITPPSADGAPRPSKAILPDADPAALNALSSGGIASLICGLALAFLLEEIGIKADAVLGHSNGETTALAYAGVFGSRELMRNIGYIGENAAEFRHVDTSKHASGVRISGILATDRAEVDAVLKQFGNQAHIMLDNCPRQLIVHVHSGLADQFETRMKATGAFVSAVPFNQAYHSPLMQAIHGRLLSSLRRCCIASPEIALYSAARVDRFPSAPRQVAELAAEQWIKTVRFGATVEKMQADGIQAFVDIGPQALLSGFAESVIADSSRHCFALDSRLRPSLHQFLRAVGQLFISGAAVDFQTLLRERDDVDLSIPPLDVSNGARTIASVTTDSAPAEKQKVGPSAANDSRAARADVTAVADAISRSKDQTVAAPVQLTALRGHGAVRARLAEDYFDLMRDFLDQQTRIAGAIFAGQRVSAVSHAPAIAAPLSKPLSKPIRQDSSRASLFDRVQQTADGAVCTLRLTKDDPFLRDHTLSARPTERRASGLPVVPFATSVELCALAAREILPGVVTGIRSANGHRWLALDHGTLDLEIKVTRQGPDRAHVVIYDVQKGERLKAFDAIVLFAAAYARGGTVRDLGPLIASARRFDLDEYRDRWLFHGRSFDILRRLDGWSDKGMQMRVVQPPARWIVRHGAHPDAATHGHLIDGVAQGLAYWFTQVDDSHFTAFPYTIDSIDIHSPPQPEDHVFAMHMECQRGFGRLSTAADLSDPETGQVMVKVSGLNLKPYELPPSYITMLYSIADRSDASQTVNVGPYHLRLISEWTPGFLQQSDAIFQRAMAHVAFTAAERQSWYALPEKGVQRVDFMLSRIVAKEASAALAPVGERELSQIEIIQHERTGFTIQRQDGIAQAVRIASVHGAAVALVLAKEAACGVALAVLKGADSADVYRNTALAAAKQAVPDSDPALAVLSQLSSDGAQIRMGDTNLHVWFAEHGGYLLAVSGENAG
ncbi:acyltransferase domain-containing protein [Allorhizobium sp. BGMRC 0089]|nr:acyltransferase domain-containing protein [Allorhizobium sonneratiae]